MTKQHRDQLEKHHKARAQKARNRLIDTRIDAVKHPDNYHPGARYTIDKQLKDL